MQQPSKNSLSIVGIIVGFLSLPATWLIFDGVEIQSPMRDIATMLGSPSAATYSGSANGFEGSVFYVPILALVSLIFVAHVAQLMSASDFFFVLHFIQALSAIAALLVPVSVIVFTLFNQGVTTGVGPYIAFAAAAIAAITLVISNDFDEVKPDP